MEADNWTVYLANQFYDTCSPKDVALAVTGKVVLVNRNLVRTELLFCLRLG